MGKSQYNFTQDYRLFKINPVTRLLRIYFSDDKFDLITYPKNSLDSKYRNFYVSYIRNSKFLFLIK